MEEIGKILISKDGSELVVEPHTQAALGECGVSYTGCLFRDDIDRYRLQRHHDLLDDGVIFAEESILPRRHPKSDRENEGLSLLLIPEAGQRRFDGGASRAQSSSVTYDDGKKT